jgi:hypothetical protein
MRAHAFEPAFHGGPCREAEWEGRALAYEAALDRPFIASEASRRNRVEFSLGLTNLW